MMQFTEAIRKKQRSSFPIQLKAFLIFLLVLGILLRFVNLEEKVYWGDEVRTSVRISGNTKEGAIEQLYNNQIINVESLKTYQFPNQEKDFADTMAALTTRPEHPPLYFVLVRLWTQFWMPWFGESVAVIRSLSVVISLFVFPAIYWLCLELFESSSIGLIAMTVVAISPLHLLYAQEARQYSLWTVAILLSGVALLRAQRLKTGASWWVYTATLILGLYTHLLFTVSIVGQGIYVLISEGWRFSQIKFYLRSISATLIAFTPWLFVIVNNLTQVGNMAAEVQKETDFSYLAARWFRNINQVFWNADLGGFNFVLVLLTLYSLWFLWIHAPKHTRLFIFTWLGVSALTLMIPDLIFGGTRSTRIRYVIPCYLAIQLTMAYFVHVKASWVKTGRQKLLRSGIILCFIGGAIACSIAAQSKITWNKSYSQSKYHWQSAEIINKRKNPLVVSDASINDVLSISYMLNSDVQLQLLGNLDELSISYSRAFLFSPSEQLKQRFDQPNTQLKMLVNFKRYYKLWQWTKQ